MFARSSLSASSLTASFFCSSRISHLVSCNLKYR
jgi:hypothetical protein